MITQETFDAAYARSKTLRVTPELGVEPGALAKWVQDNLPTIAYRWRNDSLRIGVELIGIGILAAQINEHRN